MTKPEGVVVPDFVITEADIAEYVKPFAVDYGGKVLTLKSVKSLAIDDLLEVGRIAEGNVLEALTMVSADDDTLAILKGMPHPLLFRVFAAWEASGDLEPGESDGSEASSQATGPQ